MSGLLDVRGVTLRHGDRTVVDGLSFSVAAGEFFVIIGPNGAGKTTLLRALAGLHHPAAGEILVRQRPVTGLSRRELARAMALVPQQLGTDFPFTVAETVLMGRFPRLGLLGVEGRRDLELAGEAMAFTEVQHLAGRRLGQLSGGELQRTVIARAICQQAEILLLDEPTASLDPAHQLRIMELMERLRRSHGTTVVMISHDLNLAALYADRLLLLKDGRLAALGAPRQVLTADRLEECYGCRLHVDDHPRHDAPRISLIPGEAGLGDGAESSKL